MAYPVTITAKEGEQYSAYASTNQVYPIGTKMQFADGRRYRFVENGGATLVVGDVLEQAAPEANHVTQACTANASGARSPVNTLGATAAVKNVYQEGYLCIVTTPGGGELYVIGDHAAVDSGAAITTNLAPGHAIRTALTSSSKFSLHKNPYRDVIQAPTTSTSSCVGIAVKALTSGQHGWVQTGGTAVVLASGTVVIGDRVVRLVATAGAAGPAANDIQPDIGQVIEVGNTWFVCHLTLPD